jgi:hypothetical protein
MENGDMNYIREINAFYDWLETNRLSVSAISLWYSLMHINNKTGWKNEFTVALSVLATKSGLSPRAVTNARKELAENGRISWESRDGNQSAKYRVNSLVGELQELYACNTSDKVADKVTCNTSNSYTDNATTLNKPKHKQNINNIYTPEFESWYSEYPRKQAREDSAKNFAKRRKEHGLEFILQCSKNYLDYFKTLPPDKHEYAYASNNFFGQKAYYLEYAEPKKTAKPNILQELFGDCEVR